MGDIPEGPGVYDGWLTFKRLHQVGHDRLVQERHQRTLYAQLRHGYRIAVPGGADHYAGDALTQVVRPVREGEDGHDLGGRDDVEPRLSQRPVATAADTGDYLPEAAVGGVGNPGPLNARGVEVRNGVAEHCVVHQRGQQVVGRGNGVRIAVKWMLISSSGTMRALPPPVPPPLMPKIGPSVGSRRFTETLWPNRPMPCVSPMAVVVFPSPAGVGVMPVTTTSLPWAEPPSLIASSEIFAL